MADPFYLSPSWRDFRRTVLRERQTCAVPGCNRKPTHLDHIKPRRQGGAPLDRANVQALCHNHHSAKTAGSDGGFGNPVSPGKPLRVPGCDAAGNPIDPGHRWRR